jgi:hypothetical protein
MPSTNPNYVPKCPGCGEDLEYLNYYVKASENGSASLVRREIQKWIADEHGPGGHHEQTGKFKWKVEDYDSSETNWDDEPDFECKNCGESIYIGDLECPQSKPKKEKIIKPIEPEDAVESETNIILRAPKNKDSYKEFYGNAFDISHIEICICEKCGHLISNDECNYGDNFLICPECNHQINVKENRDLIKSGKFKVKS